VIAYLLDTNVLSEPLRPCPDRRVVARLRRCEGRLATASTVWHELWFGCRRLRESAKRSAIERYLTDIVAPNVPVLPYDAAAASWHASERARLAAVGRTPAFADGQVAAVAHANDLVLVTLDSRLYASFDDVRVENWLD
jgi:tRNA(fMet)-specific endonuclease VapC